MYVGCWKILRFRTLYLGDRWVIVLLVVKVCVFLLIFHIYLFLIWDINDFTKSILPQLFKHSKFASFVILLDS